MHLHILMNCYMYIYMCIYVYMNVCGNIYVSHSEIIEDKTDSIRVLEVFKFGITYWLMIKCASNLHSKEL